MQFTIQLNVDKDYLSECFDESVRCPSKRRKIDIFLGFVFLLLGLLLLIYSNKTTITPWVFCGIGLIETLGISNRIQKYFWIRKTTNPQENRLYNNYYY